MTSTKTNSKKSKNSTAVKVDIDLDDDIEEKTPTKKQKTIPLTITTGDIKSKFWREKNIRICRKFLMEIFWVTRSIPFLAFYK